MTTPTLDEAWREAEEALPEGWGLFGVSLTVEHLSHDDWEAVAAWTTNDIFDEPPDPQDVTAIGPTAPAALLSLASSLRERKP